MYLNVYVPQLQRIGGVVCNSPTSTVIAPGLAARQHLI
jgi:hypothetical protein